MLFDSGKADLKPAGMQALTQVADVLRTVPATTRSRSPGHTDNVPIRYAALSLQLGAVDGARAVGSWSCSPRRAGPRELSAAGYGEFDPVATNDTPTGTAHEPPHRDHAAAEHCRDRVRAEPLIPPRSATICR